MELQKYYNRFFGVNEFATGICLAVSLLKWLIEYSVPLLRSIETMRQEKMKDSLNIVQFMISNNKLDKINLIVLR